MLLLPVALVSGLALAASVVRAECSVANFELFKLPYAQDALAPSISAATNKFHLEILSGAISAFNKQAQTLQSLLLSANSSLADINAAAKLVVFTSGALETHRVYFHSLAPESQGGGDTSRASPAFTDQVNSAFGSFEDAEMALLEQSANTGAGWGWLAWDTKIGGLVATFTTGEDLLDPTLKPIFSVDTFEHAYYLDYQADTQSYFKVLPSLFNWEFASKQFDLATADPSSKIYASSSFSNFSTPLKVKGSSKASNSTSASSPKSASSSSAAVKSSCLARSQPFLLALLVIAVPLVFSAQLS